MKVHHVIIQMARPRGSFTGQCEEGYYLFDGNTVTLCSQAGVPHLDGKGRKLAAKVEAGQNAKQIAGRLLRSTLKDRRPNWFGRALVYPPSGAV